MPDFRVNPGALDTFAGVLGSAGHPINLDDAFGNTALTYVNSYTPVPHDSGDLFSEIYKSNQHVVNHLQWAMPHISMLCSDTAAALKDSAIYYRNTDEASARRVDRAYDPGNVPPLAEPPTSSTGLSDPAPSLSGVPSKDAPVPDMVHWIMDKSGWFSIAGMALKLASLFGLDPVKELTQSVVGDYDELAQAGHALEALAGFERTAASTISVGSSNLAGEWSGNASVAATGYCNELSNALHGHADELDEVAEKYHLLVQTCAQIATMLSSALSTAIDQILICAASLASAGCLASVPGINVIISLIGAYQVWRTREAVAAFLRITGNVTMATEGFLGLTTGIASAFKDGSVANDFPTSPYTNGAIA